MKRVLPAILVCAWAPILTACGDDDDGGAEAEAESESEAEAEAESEGEPALLATYAAGPGAHYMAWTEDGSRGYVSDYFLQQAEQLGMLPADNLVHWFDAETLEGGVLADFSEDSDNPDMAGYQPHGMAVVGDRLLVWAGPRRACEGGDANCGLGAPDRDDALFVLDRESGDLIAIIPVADRGNEPHHVRACGNHFFAGGLLSGNVYVFDVSDPDLPDLVDTWNFAESDGLGAADDIHCHGDGLLITMMGSNALGTPGGIVELDADWNVVGVYQPEDASAFNPHGLAVSTASGMAASTDFVEPASVAAGADGNISPVVRNTIRLWNLEDWSETGVVEVCAGPMEVVWYGGSALVSCMVSGGFGWVWQDGDGSWTWTECLDLDGAGALQAMPGGVRVDDQGNLTVALAVQGEVRKYAAASCLPSP